MNLFKEIMKFILWLIIRCVYIILRRIIWTLNGVEKQVKSNKNSNVYEKTVHVRKIWMRYNFDPSLLPCTESHYITTHERFEDPEYVLKPNITLYNVKENEVYFVESDVSKDVLNSENGGFVKFAQYKLARKFLVMPMSVFIRLCETLPKPQDQKLVFIGNTARSGSTLFTQVFEETGRCIAWAEPDALNYLARLDHKDSLRESSTINIIKIMCKTPMDMYVFKIQTVSMGSVMRKVFHSFPKAKLLFMYRDALPSVKSHNRLSRALPLFDLVQRLGGLSERVVPAVCKGMDLPVQAEEFKSKLTSRFQLPFLLWATIVKQYKTMKAEDFPIAAVKYRDIMNDTDFAFMRIFNFIGQDYDDNVRAAVKRAFSRDSQRDTMVSMVELSKVKADVLDEGIIVQLNKMADRLGLPLIEEGFYAEDTITTR